MSVSTWFRFFIGCALFLMPEQVFGQDLLQKRISISERRKPLADVLKTIGQKGEFYFSYNSNIIPKDSIVSVAAADISVRDVLRRLLPGDYKYIESDKYIIIQTTDKEKWYTISGYITDGQSGSRLADVSVFERQQLASAITGPDGFFMLRLKDRERYKAAEITVSKGFYVDTTLSLIKGYDQQISLAIVPEVHSLPDMVISQYSGVERSWFSRLLVSSKLKTQSLNLRKFFVDKPYQFSLIPGVGTHGKMSGQVANKFSFNILGGYTAGVDGVEIAGLFNIDTKDVQYVQAAGLFNVVTGNVEGVQLAGISNYIKSKATGVQAAGIMNKAKKVQGVQAAGIFNVAFDSVVGIQMAGFVNGAMYANTQLSGYVNLCGYVDGLQATGFVNIAKKVHGMQASAFVNIADEVDGMQASAFVNIAHKVKGVQLTGFVNIADSSDFPIGLINVIGNGDKAIGLSIDEFGTTILAFRSGGRVLYGIVGGGGKQYLGGWLYAVEVGMGAHLNFTKHFRVNAELASLSMSDLGNQRLSDNAFRLMPSVRLGPIEMFAGAGINFSVYNFQPDYAVATNSVLWEKDRQTSSIAFRIGYKAGFQVHL